MSEKLNIVAAEYHRNGVGGLGFQVVLFRDHTDSEKGRLMVAVMPDDEEEGFGGSLNGGVGTFVLDVSMLVNGDVGGFPGSNSWRGDRYREWLAPKLKALQVARRLDKDHKRKRVT